MDPSGLDWLDNSTDFFGGWADTLTFGRTRHLRNCWGQGGYVDTNSGIYRAGGYTGGTVAAAAGGAFAWGRLGGGQFAVGISRGVGTRNPHITFGYGRNGAYTWAHGVGGSSWAPSTGTTGFITAADAGPGTLLNVTGIPIIFPSAVGAWVATQPDGGDCFRACVRGICRGYRP